MYCLAFPLFLFLRKVISLFLGRILADDSIPQAEADARTIITVLLLHDLFLGAKSRPRIICEILDAKSKDLLDVDIGCEFVLSTEVTSRVISQVAAERGLNRVFNELFAPEGNEIYLKDAQFYSNGIGKPTPWWMTQQIAASVREVAIGYFKVRQRVVFVLSKNNIDYEQDKSVLNPPQDDAIVYGPGDRIVVISEDSVEYTRGPEKK